MIRSFGLVIAAIATLAATSAMAQTHRDTGGNDDKSTTTKTATAIDMKIDKDAHATGQKEAPAYAARAGITCTVTDGYYLGASDGKDDAGKPVSNKLYEVACKEGLGQILQGPAAGPVKHYDCIAVTTTPNIRCRLPANADPKAAITPWVQATGEQCTISDVRGMGGTPTGDSFFEIACSNRLGFILKHEASGASSATDCALAVGTNVECKLTTADQIKAADRKTIETLTAASGKTCAIKDTRTIGKLTSGGAAYEVACQAGDGYVMIAKTDGSFQNAVACANADGIAGGCKLTDAATSQTQEAGTYTKLAKASGFSCEVSKYRYIGMDTKTNSEVVELACSNRQDGGVAVFPSDNSPGHVLDCVRAGSLGQQCHLTDPSLTYGSYSQALVAKGKGSCKVSGAHWLGHSATNNTDLIETACSDGLPGWVIEMNTAGQAVDLMNCGQARAAGLQCALPTNAKH